MIGMGERTTPQAVVWIARSLFLAGAAQAGAGGAPAEVAQRHDPGYGNHLCGRDLVTLFPEVVYGARTWAIRPARRPSSW